MDSFQSELFDDSDEKLAALDELFLKSSNYRNSDEYFRLLKFINRFPTLSPFNAFLIHTQNSGVNVVMTASKWAKIGRKVNYRARPLVILVPFGPVDFVYDIDDTTGDEVPEQILHPFKTSGRFNENIFHTTVKNCKKENIEYIENNMQRSSAGYAQNIKNNFSVTINSNYSVNEKYSTLIHELAHIFCGHLGVNKTSWWECRTGLKEKSVEVEAESISFLVCKRNGLKTTSESYLSNYIRDHEEMPPISFDTILTVSGYIEKMGIAGFKTKQHKIEE